MAKEMIKLLLEERQNAATNQKEVKQYSEEEVRQMVEEKYKELEKQQLKKELSFTQVIDEFMEKSEEMIKQEEVEKVKKIILTNKDGKVYFFEKKGIQKCVQMI